MVSPLSPDGQDDARPILLLLLGTLAAERLALIALRGDGRLATAIVVVALIALGTAFWKIPHFARSAAGLVAVGAHYVLRVVVLLGAVSGSTSSVGLIFASAAVLMFAEVLSIIGAMRNHPLIMRWGVGMRTGLAVLWAASLDSLTDPSDPESQVGLISAALWSVVLVASLAYGTSRMLRLRWTDGRWIPITAAAASVAAITSAMAWHQTPATWPPSSQSSISGLAAHGRYVVAAAIVVLAMLALVRRMPEQRQLGAACCVALGSAIVAAAVAGAHNYGFPIARWFAVVAGTAIVWLSYRETQRGTGGAPSDHRRTQSLLLVLVGVLLVAAAQMPWLEGRGLQGFVPGTSMDGFDGDWVRAAGGLLVLSSVVMFARGAEASERLVRVYSVFVMVISAVAGAAAVVGTPSRAFGFGVESGRTFTLGLAFVAATTAARLLRSDSDPDTGDAVGEHGSRQAFSDEGVVA